MHCYKNRAINLFVTCLTGSYMTQEAHTLAISVPSVLLSDSNSNGCFMYKLSHSKSMDSGHGVLHSYDLSNEVLACVYECLHEMRKIFSSLLDLVSASSNFHFNCSKHIRTF